MLKVNKWQLIDGELVKVKKEGKLASDLVIEMINETFDEMEQCIIDKLKAIDAGYIAARRERMAMSIDKKRINNYIDLLNQEKEHFIDFLIKANIDIEIKNAVGTYKQQNIEIQKQFSVEEPTSSVWDIPIDIYNLTGSENNFGSHDKN